MSFMDDPFFIFFQLLFFDGKISEEIFLNENAFARLFKFDELSAYQTVRQNLTGVSNVSNVCSVLEQALNRSKLSAEVQ